jgi:hypothetical protein
MSGIGRYQPQRFFKNAFHNVDADLLVFLQLELLKSGNASQKRTPPPGTMPSSAFDEDLIVQRF